jgi:DNA-binding LacI/PurR family transcriptional regulator/AraC-like DNA-binding protein
MAIEKKRIGLVLASIHTGIAQNVWASFVRTANIENTDLFIFPGGRLNARPDFENLRNPVYFLVNEENLDGCISWSSTIRYAQSNEEFAHFYRGFGNLPYVTLAQKSPGHPCVEFDAYSGMKALVSHCIQVHGGRRIAFLRGPCFHQSAQARFEGYLDALREAGLAPPAPKGAPVTGPLITDPFNWSAGDSAAAQLFESRSLAPGRDFDTLIGSSDLMTLGAIKYLASKGYHVPRDYRAAGFNNSGESQVTESPLSTVHLPFAELSGESFKILLALMGKKKHRPVEDVLLPASLVIRESCGCVDIPGNEAISPPHALEAGARGGVSVLAKLAARYLQLETAGLNAQALPVIEALLYGEEARAFALFEKALIRFFASGSEAENLFKLIEAAGRAGVVPPERFHRLQGALYRSIFRIHEQRNARARHEKEGWNTALNSLKCELLGTRDRASLIQSLARHLPKIGINAAAIVLYGDEKTSIYAGGFSPDMISARQEQRFPARKLLPAELMPHFGGGVFLVQPLFIENQSLGYFLHNVPIDDGVIFEELRSAVSYALKGIFLLEETVRAKRIAEQAERAKSEFLQTLESGLFDPLQGVTDRLEDIEKHIADNAELSRRLDELKSFVSSREAVAGSLIDFTLSRLDELSLRKTIFDPEELLPGLGEFPLLLGDTARLAQCFSLVREAYGKAEYSASLGYRGLVITFRGNAEAGPGAGGGQFSLPLAERIILLHGGEFAHNESQCVITLPWTTLGGQEPPRRAVSPQDHILALSDPALLPAGLFDLPQIRDSEAAAPGRTAFIVWNRAGAPAEDLIKVAGLRHNGEFSLTPFLCYGGKNGFGGDAASLIEAVEHALQRPEKGVVLFIGRASESPETDQLLPAEEARGKIRLERIQIDSMSAFNQTVGEINPSLIVCGGLDPAAAAEIRRHPLTVMTPIVMIASRIDNPGDVMALSQYSRLVICHQAAAVSPEFSKRLRSLAGGDEILPPHTGVLVKKAILYFDQHASSHISRWKLADAVNVSEDYLTRIFHREMGLSLWDYLNRYRIFLAAEFLRQTDATIQEIAFNTGFNDQTYFCRVFKKIYGVSPGQLRKR